MYIIFKKRKNKDQLAAIATTMNAKDLNKISFIFDRILILILEIKMF